MLSSWRTTHLKHNWTQIYKIYLIMKKKKRKIWDNRCFYTTRICSWSSKRSEYLQEYFWKITHICNWIMSGFWSKWWKVTLNWRWEKHKRGGGGLHFQGEFTKNVISNYKYSSTQERDFLCSSTQARYFPML